MGGGHLRAAVSCCSADASTWHAGLVEKGRDWKKLAEHKKPKSHQLERSWRDGHRRQHMSRAKDSTCVGGHANCAFHSYFPQECISFSNRRRNSQEVSKINWRKPCTSPESCCKLLRMRTWEIYTRIKVFHFCLCVSSKVHLEYYKNYICVLNASFSSFSFSSRKSSKVLRIPYV